MALLLSVTMLVRQQYCLSIFYIQVDMMLFLHCILSTGRSRLYTCQRYAVRLRSF